MGQLLYKLTQVPEAEADALRARLDAAGIAYYETDAGNWKVSLAAIWVTHDDDLPRARELLEQFHQEWRAERANDPAPETFWQSARRRPLQLLLALALVAGILYLSIVPLIGAWS